MMAASLAASPSFPPRSHPVPFVRSVPLASPRRGVARRTLPFPAHAGGDGGGEGGAGRILDPLATPFQVLGLDASAGYSAAQLKAAFRARVLYLQPPAPCNKRACCSFPCCSLRALHETAHFNELVARRT